jgi:hypothetical protein
VIYHVVGDDKAPTFFSVSANTGEVRVKTSLRADTDSRVYSKFKPSKFAHSSFEVVALAGDIIFRLIFKG